MDATLHRRGLWAAVTLLFGLQLLAWLRERPDAIEQRTPNSASELGELAARVDPNLADKAGRTALRKASAANHKAVVELLRRHGAR